MLRNIVKTETREVEGILLGIGSSEEKDCLSVKIALSIESNWNFGTIVDINIPVEYLYTMAEEDDKEIFELVGVSIKVKIAVINDKIKNIEEITVQ